MWDYDIVKETDNDKKIIAGDIIVDSLGDIKEIKDYINVVTSDIHYAIIYHRSEIYAEFQNNISLGINYITNILVEDPRINNKSVTISEDGVVKIYFNLKDIDEEVSMELNL